MRTDPDNRDMTPTTPPLAKPARYTALDGLRGFAALIVVIAHSYFFLQPIIDPNTQFFLYRSYISFFFSGREAVAIFFVLSGFVITLPVLKRGKNFDWGNYYISRFLRLYLPTAASLLFATALILLIPRLHPADGGSWVQSSTGQFNFGEFTTQMLFFIHTQNGFPSNNVLWSLRWEMYFSLLLPLFVGLGLLLKKFWWLLTIFCIAMLWVGFSQINQNETAQQFFATFGLGVILAVKRDKLGGLSERVMLVRPLSVLLAFLLPFLSITALIWSHFIGLDPQNPQGYVLAEVLYPLGAAGAVLSALYLYHVKKFLNTKVMQFLGRISFSLYLVHVPIIVTTGYVLNFQHRYISVIISFALSILAAVLFQKFVEAPSHRFAKFTGRSFSNFARRLRQPPGAQSLVMPDKVPPAA